jgi:hypothetical protein
MGFPFGGEIDRMRRRGRNVVTSYIKARSPAVRRRGSKPTGMTERAAEAGNAAQNVHEPDGMRRGQPCIWTNKARFVNVRGYYFQN